MGWGVFLLSLQPLDGQLFSSGFNLISILISLISSACPYKPPSSGMKCTIAAALLTVGGCCSWVLTAGHWSKSVALCWAHLTLRDGEESQKSAECLLFLSYITVAQECFFNYFAHFCFIHLKTLTWSMEISTGVCSKTVQKMSLFLQFLLYCRILSLNSHYQACS